MTPQEELRHRRRAERMRRDRMRMHRQRALVVLVLAVFAVVGTAFALRPASPQPQTAHAASTAPLVGAQAASAETTHAATEATRTATPAKKKPKKAAKKIVIGPLKPAPGVKTIVVDKSDQLVILYKANGKVVDHFSCSSGVVYPRVGKYKVFGHDPQSWSQYDNTTFYYFTKFAKSDKNNNIGFHSIPQTPDGKVVGGLGQPESHGCVRLSKDKAKFVFSWAAVGTRVIVRA